MSRAAPFLLLLCACDGTHRHIDYAELPGEDTGGPQLRIDPERVSFGTLSAGEDVSTENFTLTNMGGEDLRILDLTVMQDGQSFTLGALEQSELAPRTDTTVEVSFSPTTGGEHSAFVEITSDDPDSPHTLDLTGEAVVP